MTSNGESIEPSTKPFAYDVSDLRALNIQVTRWWMLLPSIAIFGFLLWLFSSLMLEEGFNWILTGVLILVGIAASGPWTWRPLLVHRSLRRQGLLKPMVIWLSRDYVIVDSNRGDARIKWTGIRTVKRTRDRLFLFSSKNLAHIIPRRAFDTDAQFEGFAAIAQERWEQVAKSVTVE